MNPSMTIAKKLAEAVEFFEKLPDVFEDDAMAERVGKCLEEWKREAQAAVQRKQLAVISDAQLNRKKEHA